jgi:TonB family protein
MNKYLCILAFASIQLGSAAWAQAPAAQLSTCAKPVWPKEALRNEYQGRVTLAFLIGEDGTVRESRVEKTSGYPILDIAAQEGLERCKFKPGLKDGIPVEAWMKMQYVWTLDIASPEKMSAALAQARVGAERGEAASENKLGMIYLNGQGVPRDLDEGKKWLLKAADQGQADAQQTLGMLAMPRTINGDAAEAMTWFRKAADQGRAMSQYLLGMNLLKQGNAEEGRTWLDKAARQGHTGAQTALAQILLKTRQAEDQAEAITLLGKAAEQQDRSAQVLLGQSYETGNGVAQDYTQAAKLYNKAAIAGNHQAQLALARLYEQGLGVPVDNAKALRLRRDAMVCASPPQ